MAASGALGEDLVTASEDAERINDTRIAQPLMLAAGVGTYRAWIDAGGQPPAVAAGHSLGEYAALVCSGKMGFLEAVKVVRRRAEAMQEAVPAGTGRMCAVLGLGKDEVGAACGSVGGDVWPVNFNAPGQVVIAGLAEAVEAASKACGEAGAKRVMPLPVSVPSHCPLMEPALAPLKEALEAVEMGEGDFPVVHNATNQPADGPDEVRVSLADQLVKPVDWVSLVGSLGERAETVVECGPSNVLHGLNRRILDASRCRSLAGKGQIAELA